MSKVVTGFRVTFVASDNTDAFVTHLLHRPVDGRHYIVFEVVPVIFQPAEGFRIDDSNADVPKVVSLTNGHEYGLNAALAREYITVADRYERSLPIVAAPVAAVAGR